MEFNHEWLMIVAMGAGGVLFAAGGTGFKWARRFVLPVVLTVVAGVSGIIWWKCALYWVAQTGTLHLGYGEKLPYWRKALTFVAYVIPTLILGFSWWQLITPILMLGLFKLSNMKWSSNIFVWKVCEFIYGATIGIIVSTVIK